ncbi:MAG: hypothetical protein QW478_08905 [Candidatus Micrarchaeaceae archaeon]
MDIKSFYTSEGFVQTWAEFDAIIEAKNKDPRRTKKLTKSQVICDLIKEYVAENKELLNKPIDAVATPDKVEQSAPAPTAEQNDAI